MKKKQQDRCYNTKRYKGIKKPRCLGGKGCWGCWAKYILNNPDYGKIEPLSPKDLKRAKGVQSKYLRGGYKF